MSKPVLTLEDGGPAFPQNDLSGYGMGPAPNNNGGMSLRDWFAGQALAGQVAYEGMEGCDAGLIAGCAYEMADAMLAASRLRAVSQP